MHFARAEYSGTDFRKPDAEEQQQLRRARKDLLSAWDNQDENLIYASQLVMVKLLWKLEIKKPKKLVNKGSFTSKPHTQCCYPDCERRALCKGLCRLHYMWMRQKKAKWYAEAA